MPILFAQRPHTPLGHLRVQLLRQRRHLALRYLQAAKRFGNRAYLARRYALHVHLQQGQNKCLFAAGQLQPVQGAFAGQRRFKVPLAAEHRQQRIGAQLLVVVEVFIAQRQPIDALRQHLGQWMLDQQGRAAVAEAARQPAQQVDLAVRLPQQQRTAVA